MDVLVAKGRDAVARGATEFCIQGGIHPEKDHTHYHEILTSLKAAFPQVHIHAFSPEEIDHGHKKSGMALADYLTLAEGRRPRDDPRHGGGDPRRRDPPGDRAAQARHRALDRDHRGRAPRRPALDRDRDVRPHREVASRRGAHGHDPRDPEAHRRLHRVRAARLHPREEPPLPAPARAARLVGTGGHARRRRRAPLPAAVDPQHPDVVGEDGDEARAVRAALRRQRLRRHADGRVDLARVGLATTARISRPRRCAG